MFELENVDCSILKIDSLKTGDAPVTLVTGASGSGKTTLLRLLCNIIPCRGTIKFLGENILSINPVEYRRHVTMISQTAFVINGSIADNINYICRLLDRKPATDAEMKKALETVMLEKSPADAADVLSGGEKQRLCLARALFAKPQMLLLDEPASALDFESASSVLASIEDEVLTRGCHIMVVSHWAETVGRSAARLIVGGGTARMEPCAQ